MAIIHRADLSPTKPEILHAFLSDRSWGDGGEITVLGAYRFDDPAGEVGVECHLVQAGDSVFHLPLTYRAAPLEDGEDAFVGTMQHSVLGERFVYDGLGDEIAIDCFARALAGEQEQAELDVYDGETLVERRPQSVLLHLETDEGEEAPSLAALMEDGEPFTVARTVGGLDGAVRLVATWGGEHAGNGVVASC